MALARPSPLCVAGTSYLNWICGNDRVVCVMSVRQVGTGNVDERISEAILIHFGNVMVMVNSGFLVVHLDTRDLAVVKVWR